MTKEIIENDPYKLAGVDIDAGNSLVDQIKKSVAASHNKNVLDNIGGFAGMYELDKDIENPVLVACTDGVGTKVSLAQQYNDLSGIGQDLVAMCVNDLIVCGAKPLFFLDYYASSKLNVNEATTVVKSIADACVKSDCALLGGETAEMPGHYIDNNFDLAGFSVGCVSKDKIIKNDNVMCGNVLIGIESSGPHSNGFSLIRKIIKESKVNEEEKNIIAKINLCIEKASDDLLKLVGASDGLQTSNRRLSNIRHFSNTLFNIMRGGIFDNHYNIEKLDFSDYIKRSNKKVFSN